MKSLTLVTLLTVAALTAPALAAPNDGRFARSSEGLKLARADVCQLMHDYLTEAERQADQRAGTKAAEKYAKEADEWWAAGERNGCAWAQ